MGSREWDSLDEVQRQIVQAHLQDVPIKLSKIAHALGLRLRASTLPAGISGEIRPDPERAGSFIIKVNRHDSSQRQRFTIAHEISHYLLHEDEIGDGITDDVLYRSGISDSREAQANRLAADILMPDSLIGLWLDRARSLNVQNIPLFLAEQFDVSEAAIKIKLGLT